MGKRSRAPLKAGMCIAIEPVINAGDKEVFTSSDGWTILRDGKPSPFRTYHSYYRVWS